VQGPDGAFWFVQSTANAIGRIDFEGNVTSFRIPREHTSPRGIALTPHGDFLITENFTNIIARMTADGTVADEYPIPTAGSGPRALLVTPGGRAFFSQHDAGQIGEIIVAR
jgi:virginiamycin B lyase